MGSRVLITAGWYEANHGSFLAIAAGTLGIYFADLMGGFSQPVWVHLNTPPRLIRYRGVAVCNHKWVFNKDLVLPGIIIQTFDRKFQIFPRIRYRAQQVHGEQSDH